MSYNDFTVLTGRKPNPSYFIDNGFRKEILLHLCKNKITKINPPLILAVQGKQGEGKTTHILEVCNSLGVNVVFIHGSALSGKHEKDPTIILTEAYKEASRISKSGKNAILLVDDIDTSVASMKTDVEYTVNSQLLNGTLMNIADNPYQVGGENTERVPLFFTGNNLSDLYSPLARHGRMRIFSYQPGYEVKLNIALMLFKDNLRGEDKKGLEELVLKYQEKPVSFFSTLKNELFDSYILEIVNRHSNISSLILNSEIEKVLDTCFSLDLIKTQAELLDSKVLKNYLEK